MSFEDERRAIEGRFSSNYSDTAVKYENVPFDQPSTSWVALNVLSGEGINGSFGGTTNLQRNSGVIQVTIHTTEDSGTKTNRQLGDTVAGVFRNAQFSAGSSGTITCRMPAYIPRGIVDGWYTAVVSVPYRRDKIA